MTIFCAAPMISWALVFSDPLSDQVGMQPISSSCFASHAFCLAAADAANYAFAIDHSGHRADCKEQPANNSSH